MSSQEMEIRALEDRRYAAMLAGDVQTLADLCSDAMIYTHSRGDRDTRASYLARVAEKFFVYHEIDHPVEKIVLGSDSALVFGAMRARARVNGEERTLNNSCLAVWVREAGAWKFAAFQPTPILV